MSAREFYEEAKKRVGEIVAACEKDAAHVIEPPTCGRFSLLPFAVGSVALSTAALTFASMRVWKEPNEGTAIAAVVMAFMLPLCALMRALYVFALRTPDAIMPVFLAAAEVLLAMSCVATTVFPLSLFDGLAVRAAAMFALDAIFCLLAIWVAIRIRYELFARGSSVLEDARSLERGLDSALACYDTDAGLGEYNNLHGFRKRLAEVEAAYLAEIN